MNRIGEWTLIVMGALIVLLAVWQTVGSF